MRILDILVVAWLVCITLYCLNTGFKVMVDVLL